ncbi:hypothetical protein D3C75_1233720 [compost metagenome]
MPVIPTAWFKHHIANGYSFGGQHVQVAGAGEILRIGVVFWPFGENTVTVKFLVHLSHRQIMSVAGKQPKRRTDVLMVDRRKCIAGELQ